MQLLTNSLKRNVSLFVYHRVTGCWFIYPRATRHTAVLDLIGFATPYWSSTSTSGFEGNTGLWRYCYTANSLTVCGPVGDYDLESWFKAVQAMEILGFLCLLAAVVVVILKLFVLKDKPILKFVGIGCLATAAAFILLGVVNFGARLSSFQILGQNFDNLHFSFAFVILAAISAIVAAVLFGLDK